MDLERARPHIEAALSYAGGTHTYEDVVAMIHAGRLKFWPGPNSAVVTEIIEYPRRRTLHFFLAGGNLAELEVMLPGIIEWGRTTQGCDSASLTGRKGWERTFLKREGWTANLVVMTKAL
jgi:hypothetical protein